MNESKQSDSASTMRSDKIPSTVMAERIRIAAAIITDGEGRVLLVRKRDTRFFLQPGGKLQDGETALETLARELDEELGCSLVKADFVGVFSAPAANEAERIVEAELFRAEIAGELRIAAEIEEMIWIEPDKACELLLAPLTRDYVIPMVLPRRS